MIKLDIKDYIFNVDKANQINYRSDISLIQETGCKMTIKNIESDKTIEYTEQRWIDKGNQNWVKETELTQVIYPKKERNYETDDHTNYSINDFKLRAATDKEISGESSGGGDDQSPWNKLIKWLKDNGLWIIAGAVAAVIIYLTVKYAFIPWMIIKKKVHHSPNPGPEKIKKLEAGEKVKPPKKWWDKMRAEIAAEPKYKDRSSEDLDTITAGIWYGYDKAAQEKIIKEE